MLTHFLAFLAPVLADDITLFCLIGFLVLWAGLSALRLWRAVSRLAKACAAACVRLGEETDPVAFSALFETASAGLAGDPLLCGSWIAFRQTLIVPSTPNRPIRATESPKRWFDCAALIRKAGTDLRYHAALPGLLVGAGLFVTFLGLAAALSSAATVAAPDVTTEARNAALRALLGAASVKFVTSLVGLFLSIAYTVIRQGQLRRSDAAMLGFCGALLERMPLTSQAVLQAEANGVAEKQYAEVQRIGTEFFVNLGSTLEREFGAGLSTHIGPLAAALDRLAGKLANENEDAMQSMLASFLQRLEGAVGESMRSTTQTLDTLGARLDGLQGALDAAAQRMGRAAEEMASGMGRGAQSALAGITGQIGSLVVTLREAADEARRNNREAGDDMARRMADTAAGLTHAVASFQRRIEEGAAEGLGRLAGPIEALLLQLRSLADDQRRAGAESTAALVATVGQSAAALDATASRMADVLGGGAADASNRLVAATEAMRDDLRSVLDRFGATLDDSGAALARGAAAGGDALRGAATALGGDIGLSAARLREAGEAAGSALRAGGQEARAAMGEAAQTLVQGGSGLGERLAAIGDSAQSLARQVREVDAALRAGTAPLAAAAADMRQAAEAARTGLAPWREATEALRSSAGKLSDAASAVAETQRRAAELARGIEGATDRFGGLDRNLAEIFGRLRDGLNEYQSSIRVFVTGVDQGFATGVRNLSGIVKSLEESIEELADSRRPKRIAAE